MEQWCRVDAHTQSEHREELNCLQEKKEEVNEMMEDSAGDRLQEQDVMGIMRDGRQRWRLLL